MAWRLDIERDDSHDEEQNDDLQGKWESPCKDMTLCLVTGIFDPVDTMDESAISRLRKRLCIRADASDCKRELDSDKCTPKM